MKLLFWIVSLLLLASCAQPSKPVWTELPSVEMLLQQLHETTGKVRSLDGEATVNLTYKGKFFSSQQFLLLQKAELLRTDVLTGFGQLVLKLTSDGQDLAVFMNTTVPGRFYHGAATPENLARFTRIPLQTKEMVRLLLYDPPLIEYRQTDVLLNKGELLLRLFDSELQQDLSFDERLRLIGCRYFLADKLFLEVRYQKFDPVTLFPQTIRLEMPEEEIETSIKFSVLQTNIEIPVERFRLTPPAGIPIEVLP